MALVLILVGVVLLLAVAVWLIYIRMVSRRHWLPSKWKTWMTRSEI